MRLILDKAKGPNLVPRKVSVVRNGGVYIQTVWVKPGDDTHEKRTPVSNDDGSGKNPSLIKNPDGSAMSFYHGTNEVFDSFRSGNGKYGRKTIYFFPEKDKQYASQYGKTIVKVNLKASKIFDFENPEHQKELLSVLRSDPKYEDWMEKEAKSGDWEMIEKPVVQKHLKQAGYDAYFVNDHPGKAIAVFSPKQIVRNDVEKSLTWSGFKLQGREKFFGMDISIENRKGSVRSGVDKDGHKWRTRMHFDYGYIRRTVGRDKDHLDCYLGPDRKSEKVFIVHQNDPVTGKYDEDKVMFGFSSAEEAKKAYLRQYDRPDFFGSMDEVNMEKFKEIAFSQKGKKLVIPVMKKSVITRLVFFLQKALGRKGHYVPVVVQVTREGKTFPMRVWKLATPKGKVYDKTPDQFDLFDVAEVDEQERAEMEAEEKKRIEIPEHLKDLPLKKEFYVIESKGRKYFKAHPYGKSYTIDIEINDVSKDYEPGKEYQIQGFVKKDISRYGTKTTVYPATLEQISIVGAEQDRKDAESAVRMVEEAAEKGYVSDKGVERFKALEYKKYPDLIERFNTAVEMGKNAKRMESIKHWIGYVEDAADKGYLYTNGVLKLRNELKVADFPKLNERFEAAVSRAKQKEIEKKTKNEDGTEKIRMLYPDRGYHPGMNTPVRLGSRIVVFTGSGKSFRIDEDHPSAFGSHLLGHEGEYGSFFYGRPATEEEVKQLEDREKGFQEQKEQKEQNEKEYRQIIKEVQEQGVRPEGTLLPEGETYFDTQNIYGGGDWFVIGKDSIWYVQNNGMDGDDWSLNNIRTGGAGAIGWKVPYSKELEDRIKTLNEKMKEDRTEKSIRLVIRKDI